MKAGISDLLVDGKAVVNAGRQYKQISSLNTNAQLESKHVCEASQREAA